MNSIVTENGGTAAATEEERIRTTLTNCGYR